MLCNKTTLDYTMAEQPENAPENEQNQFVKIANLREDIEKLKHEIDKFSGITQDRDYEFLTEVMVRCIIELDNMEIGDSEAVKQKRKEAIQFIQARMKVLGDKLKDNKQAQAGQKMKRGTLIYILIALFLVAAVLIGLFVVMVKLSI